MHLPDIDAIQFIIRNRRIVERDGNTRPRPADTYVIHGKNPSCLAKIMAALRPGLLPGSISTFTIAISAPLSHRIAKITTQGFVTPNRHRHHGSNRFSPKCRKRDCKLETCAPHFGEETHLTGMHLVALLHSEFGIGSIFGRPTEITAHNNATNQRAVMLDTTA